MGALAFYKEKCTAHHTFSIWPVKPSSLTEVAEDLSRSFQVTYVATAQPYFYYQNATSHPSSRLTKNLHGYNVCHSTVMLLVQECYYSPTHATAQLCFSTGMLLFTHPVG